MTKKIWNGEGEVQPDEAYFTMEKGQIVGRPYVRKRVKRALGEKSRFTKEQHKAALERTVDNDEWLGPRNGYLVSALCRDAIQNLYEEA